MVDAEARPDFPNISRPLNRKDDVRETNPQTFHLAQGVDELFGETVAEVILIPSLAEIGNGKTATLADVRSRAGDDGANRSCNSGLQVGQDLFQTQLHVHHVMEAPVRIFAQAAADELSTSSGTSAVISWIGIGSSRKTAAVSRPSCPWRRRVVR